MALISVTRLRLRSLRFVLPFVPYALASNRQARRATGFRGGLLALEWPLCFWTITAWDDEAAMRAYRNADAHRRAMPKLLHWCDEASVVHWEQDADALPEPGEALRRMLADGRLSKVSHPSPAHTAKRIAARLPRAGQVLRPVASAPSRRQGA